MGSHVWIPPIKKQLRDIKKAYDAQLEAKNGIMDTEQMGGGLYGNQAASQSSLPVMHPAPNPKKLEI